MSSQLSRLKSWCSRRRVLLPGSGMRGLSVREAILLSSLMMMLAVLLLGLQVCSVGLAIKEWLGYLVQRLSHWLISGREISSSGDGLPSSISLPSSRESLGSFQGISRWPEHGQWEQFVKIANIKVQLNSSRPATWPFAEMQSSSSEASMRPMGEWETGQSPTLPSALGKQAVIYCSPLGHAYITTRPRQEPIRRGGRILPAD